MIEGGNLAEFMFCDGVIVNERIDVVNDLGEWIFILRLLECFAPFFSSVIKREEIYDVLWEFFLVGIVTEKIYDTRCLLKLSRLMLGLRAIE